MSTKDIQNATMDVYVHIQLAKLEFRISSLSNVNSCHSILPMNENENRHSNYVFTLMIRHTNAIFAHSLPFIELFLIRFTHEKNITSFFASLCA